MKDFQRPLIAYTAYRILTNDTPRCAYAMTERRYFGYSGTATMQAVYIHDEERDRVLSGGCTSRSPNHPQVASFQLYNYATGFYLTLNTTPNAFSGYDYRSQSYFSGTINGNYISLYDYQTGSYYNFITSYIMPKNPEKAVAPEINRATQVRKPAQADYYQYDDEYDYPEDYYDEQGEAEAEPVTIDKAELKELKKQLSRQELKELKKRLKEQKKQEKLAASPLKDLYDE